MTIEILGVSIILDEDGQQSGRHVDISVTDGLDIFLWGVGGLPLTGDLQPILDANEVKYLQEAIAKGQVFDVFDLKERQVLKALTLVVLDEINILRVAAGLSPRTEGQIRGAIKSKLSQP